MMQASATPLASNGSPSSGLARCSTRYSSGFSPARTVSANSGCWASTNRVFIARCSRRLLNMLSAYSGNLALSLGSLLLIAVFCPRSLPTDDPRAGRPVNFMLLRSITTLTAPTQPRRIPIFGLGYLRTQPQGFSGKQFLGYFGLTRGSLTRIPLSVLARCGYIRLDAPTGLDRRAAFRLG